MAKSKSKSKPKSKSLLPALLTSLFSLLLSCALYWRRSTHASDRDFTQTRPGGSVQQNKEFQTFFEWVEKNGGAGLKNVRIGLFDKDGHQVRGLAAARNLAYGEDVLRIPGDVILSLDHPTMRSSPFRGVKLRAFRGVTLSLDYDLSPLTENLRSGLYLATERRKLLNGNSSFWAPYIKTLPTPDDFASHHPAYAEPGLLDDFAALPGVEFVTSQSALIKEVWREQSKKWIKLAQQSGADTLTFEDFKWGFTIVYTRRFGTQSQADWTRESYMVPISDLFNHRHSAESYPNHNPRDPALHNLVHNVKDYPSPDGSSHFQLIQASRDIREGEELTGNYRDENNQELLMSYGFTMADNPIAMPQLSKKICKQLKNLLKKEIPDESPQSQILRSMQALGREQCAEVGKNTKADL